MSPRVLLESSRGQFWENCRNRVRGWFCRNRETFPRDVSGTPAKPDVTTCPTSHRTLSDLADVDASQPLVFPELPTNSMLSRLGARSGSQRGPSPPHGHPVGPPTPPQGLSPLHGRRTPCHGNAAAWCIGTCLTLVQTISLPPCHPCTCTPQTKKWCNLHRVATTHS